MKLIPRFLILAIIATSLHQSINAEEPGLREQFKTAVADYQKDTTPTNALKVIEIYKQLEPPPAVPEEAREPFVMGATVLNESKDAAAAAKAVELFGKAIQLAPWFAEAYYNRALARETAGQFSEATDDLKRYLEFKLTDTERREAQDKIYALKAKAEITTAKKTEEEKVAAAKKVEEDKVTQERVAAERERLRPTVEGKWSNGMLPFQVVRNGERFTIIDGIQLGIKAPNTWRARGVVADRQNIRFQPESDNSGVHNYPIELSLSPDGSKLVGWFLAPDGDKNPTAFTRLP